MSNESPSAERAPAEPDITAQLRQMRGESQARSARWELIASIYGQSFWIACAYLLFGIGAELGRDRFLVAESAARFIDTLPLAVIRFLGLLDPYLQLVVFGNLSPFWNRALLSSIGLGIIFAQATLVALVVATLHWSASPRR